MSRPSRRTLVVGGDLLFLVPCTSYPCQHAPHVLTLVSRTTRVWHLWNPLGLPDAPEPEPGAPPRLWTSLRVRAQHTPPSSTPTERKTR